MNRQTKAGLLLAVVAGGILAWHWSPSRQTRLHQAHLFTALENRDWKSAASFLSPQYRDRWNQTKPRLLTRLPQAFQDFLACGILAEERSLARHGSAVLIQSRVRIVGSGGPIAQFLINQSETLTEPFTLTWQQASWRPWDWALTSADQPQLEIPAELEP